MNLAEIRPGEKFRIKSVSAVREVGKRLSDMGFVNGVEGRVLRIAHVGDPIEVCILDYNVSIRKSEAEQIAVEQFLK